MRRHSSPAAASVSDETAGVSDTSNSIPPVISNVLMVEVENVVHDPYKTTEEMKVFESLIIIEFFTLGLSMKNTARTTVREGRQSSDNTYVRIAAAEQNCLQALCEHWSGGHIRRQTVPDVGTGDREVPGSNCRQVV